MHGLLTHIVTCQVNAYIHMYTMLGAIANVRNVPKYKHCLQWWVED